MLSWPLILSITPLQLIGTSRRVDTSRYVATHREPGMNMSVLVKDSHIKPNSILRFSGRASKVTCACKDLVLTQITDTLVSIRLAGPSCRLSV